MDAEHRDRFARLLDMDDPFGEIEAGADGDAHLGAPRDRNGRSDRDQVRVRAALQRTPPGGELSRPVRGRKHGDVMAERAQFAREGAGIQISRRLTARKKQPEAQGTGRVKRRGSSASLIRISVTERSTARSPAFCEAENAI